MEDSLDNPNGYYAGILQSLLVNLKERKKMLFWTRF